MLKINARTREAGKKLGTLRKEGLIPAVIYGRNQESLPITLKEKEFDKVYSEAGESKLVDFELEDGKEKNVSKVLIQDIAFDPITSKPIHIDLYKVRMDEKLTAEVPLVFKGESEAVRTEGGVLVKNIHEVEVKCLPGDLPAQLEIDISFLKTFEDKILVKDIKLPQGVEVVSPPAGEFVVLVEPPRTEEELKALEEEVVEDLSKVEGVKPEAEEEEGEKEPKETAEEEKSPEAKEESKEK